MPKPEDPLGEPAGQRPAGDPVAARSDAGGAKAPKVSGYTPLSPEAILLMNKIKEHEEQVLRAIDELTQDPSVDQRFLAIARTELQKSYMCLVRAIAKPQRIAELVHDPL